MTTTAGGVQVFQMPTREKTIAALGDIAGLPKDQQIAFNLDCKCFPPLRKPRKGDWLRSHNEKGQSLKMFSKNHLRAQPHATFKTIFIQPWGDFKSARSAALFCACEPSVVRYMYQVSGT